MHPEQRGVPIRWSGLRDAAPASTAARPIRKTARAMSPAVPLLAALALAACTATPPPLGPDTRQPPETARASAPDDARANRFAIGFLDAIQPRSVALRREFCGFFHVTETGAIAATPPRVGDFAGCEMPVPRAGAGVFASYHTHSAFAPGYDNEVPSLQDLRNDVRLGIDGYVSTPGGRVWRVDHATRSAVQLCGLGCVFMDPGFVPLNESGIRARYSMADLRRRAAAN
jgi:hypothetical protein